ncbi:hypothetical protein WHR41_08028 [Cladosporium halotolerans]|uniref:Nephrocystin 3-like N-terminal domain-containing protein n=1 Tax=Cladosporium halotolerans TaxID=1052096 RepID=A0AB34KGQ6_9PEZI
MHSPLGYHERNTDSNQMVKEALAFDEMDDRYATVRTAHTDTCRWFFEKEAYKIWREPSCFSLHNGFFWIKGKPGAGKSTLMKAALQYGVTNLDDIVISFFFNARGTKLQQTTEGMYRSLIHQMLDKIPSAATAMPVLKGPRSNQEWPIELLKEVFQALVTSLSGHSVTCYVDALDECNISDARDMIEFFDSIGQLISEKEANFRVLLSSRHYPHIDIAVCQEMILESQEGHKTDISKYRLRPMKPKQSAEIQADIEDRASGIFLWVVLVINILKDDIARGQVHQLKVRLRRVPEDLNKLFEQILRRGSQNDKILRLTIFWIMYASRPLSREELYFAVMTSSACNDAVVPWNKDEIDPDDMQKFILDSSKGLAEWTKGKKPTVQFIHESVREYFKNGGLQSIDPTFGQNKEATIHEELKVCCQTYADRVSVLIDCADSDNFREGINEAHPFLKYATYGMLYHADNAQCEGKCQGEYLREFPTDRWQMMSNMCEKFAARRLHTSNKLYILALNSFCNLLEILQDVLSEETWHDLLNLSGEQHRSPLGAAVHSGDHQVIEFLLKHGASPDSKGKDNKSCLWVSIRKGD